MLSRARRIVIMKSTFGVRYTNFGAIISKLQISRNLETVKARNASTKTNIWFVVKTEIIKIIPFPKNG